MKVLITGSGGFVGRAVVEVLGQEHGHRLRLFDRVAGERLVEGAETVIGDIGDFEAVAGAMEGVDAVVNLAIAGGPGDYKTPAVPMRVNVQGTANVLEAARRAGVRRIVHMSSGAVVTGYSRDTFIHVELPHKFSELYPLTKSLQERLCEQYAVDAGMTVIALRPWSVSDGRTMTSKSGEPLRYGSGFFGLVCRYDLGEACVLGLAVALAGFQPFHIMATDEGERWFDIERTHRVLAWRPRETFASLKAAA